MSKMKRYHYLRQSRIVHICAALGKQFSLREWRRYTEINGWDISDKVVASVNGFNFNIYDVCLNSKIPVEWNDGNIIDTSSYRTAITNKIEKALLEVQEKFNPRQLSLFDL